MHESSIEHDFLVQGNKVCDTALLLNIVPYPCPGAGQYVFPVVSEAEV